MAGSPPLDPGLAAILASIRSSVGREGGLPSAEPADMPGPADTQPAAAAAVAAGPTLEQFVADLVRPHIRAWVDRHLPEIVQTLAAEEIRRLTGG